MPNELTGLRIREVSLVDRPANAETDPATGAKIPRATVALLKVDAGDDDPVMKAVDGKMVDGKVFPRKDFAYTPSDNVSDWKLRLT